MGRPRTKVYTEVEELAAERRRSAQRERYANDLEYRARVNAQNNANAKKAYVPTGRPEGRPRIYANAEARRAAGIAREIARLDALDVAARDLSLSLEAEARRAKNRRGRATPAARAAVWRYRKTAKAKAARAVARARRSTPDSRRAFADSERARRAVWTPERKEEHRQYCLEWNDANRERKNAHERARRAAMSPDQKAILYAQLHNSRTRAGATMTAAVVNIVLQKSQCHYCEVPISRDLPKYHPRRSTIDHKIPIAKGGTHAIYNLVACCRRCNSKKNVRPYASFVATISHSCAH